MGHLGRIGFSAGVFFLAAGPCYSGGLGLQDSRPAQAGNQSSKPSQGKATRSPRAKASPRGSNDGHVRLTGKLVKGGAECQRFLTFDNKYYTLEGNLRGFRTGDTVEITGKIPQASHCMQDTPVRVETIQLAKPSVPQSNHKTQVPGSPT